MIRIRERSLRLQEVDPSGVVNLLLPQNFR